MNVNVQPMEHNVIQINGGITINVKKTCKKHHICEIEYVLLDCFTCIFTNYYGIIDSY